MNVGPRALWLTKSSEGCKLHAYRDSGGIWTIGVGATGPGIGPDVVWTQGQADTRLAVDLCRFAGYTAALLHGQPTTPTQFGALVDACYNAGPGNLAKSPMLAAHLARDYASAASAWPLWHVRDRKGVVQPGLLKRRAAERALYLGNLPAFDKLTGFKA